MYKNILKGMVDHNIPSMVELGRMIGLKEKSIRNKMHGRTEFTHAEMRAIQQILGGSLDDLFATE